MSAQVDLVDCETVFSVIERWRKISYSTLIYQLAPKMKRVRVETALEALVATGRVVLWDSSEYVTADWDRAWRHQEQL